MSAFLKSFLGWFAILYIALFITDYFFDKKNAPDTTENVILKPLIDSVVIGNLPEFEIRNNLKQKVVFSSPCEKDDTMAVYRLVNTQQVSVANFKDCNGKNVDGVQLNPGESTIFSFRDFSADIFSESGKYQLEMKFDVDDDIRTILSEPIEIETPGMFRLFFRAIISKPLFNLLVYFTFFTIFN